MILETASACFSSRGYAATTLDHIIERCGGSKSTIYEIFGSKRGLLEALIQDRSRLAAMSLAGCGQGHATSSEVIHLAEQLFDLAFDRQWLETLRLVVAEGRQQPALQSLFLSLAVGPLEEELHNFFQRWTWIEGPSSATASEIADLFLNLVIGTCSLRSLAAGRQVPAGPERRRHIDLAAAAFLRIAKPPPEYPSTPA